MLMNAPLESFITFLEPVSQSVHLNDNECKILFIKWLFSSHGPAVYCMRTLTRYLHNYMDQCITKYSLTSLMRTLIAQISRLHEVNSKSQLLSTIISMKCNSFRANFISPKSLLIWGEILVPTPNNSSIVCPISSNCRRWRRCEKR